MSALPAGTVTFLFTDIEGSTQLLRQLGDDYQRVLADQRRILRETLTGAGGSEIDTQCDAFFFSYTRARDAVAGAVETQRALSEHDWPEGVKLRVRMGLHTGEPAVGEEGYVGLDVVRASRICAAGHGGQILLSETTRALLGSDVPDGMTLRDLGPQSLKDLEDERIYELAADDGGERFPQLKTEKPRSGAPSGAEILGADFGQRVQDYVARSLHEAFAPPPPPTRKLPSGLLLGAGAAAIAAIAILVLLLKL